MCQRKVKKGNVKKVPLRSMLLIDMSFKRVAVDIIRPIAPPSEASMYFNPSGLQHWIPRGSSTQEDND